MKREKKRTFTVCARLQTPEIAWRILFGFFSECDRDRENGVAVNGDILIERRNVKHILARSKALQWTKSYVLPEFPYDVKCMLAEQKCPDHSMRIRIIEFLQADMTKYLEGSLYPSTQQYNDVVNALLQAHPFLDEDGCGFVSDHLAPFC
ncbi:hypothetical protein H8958_011674 [Nasalis larvatus]